LTALFKAAFGMNQNAEAINAILGWYGIRCGRHSHRHCAPVGAEQVKKNG